MNTATQSTIQLILMALLIVLSGCGATESDPTGVEFDVNNCPLLDGRLYKKVAAQSEEQNSHLQFLSSGQLFIADPVTLSGGGWFGATCESGLFHLDINQIPYLIWSNDFFETIMLSPADNKENPLTYQFDGVF